MNFIKMVQQEIYDWDMIPLNRYMTREEWFRLSLIKNSLGWRSNTLRERSIDRGNMIYRWFLYGSPDFKEYENAPVQLSTSKVK